MCQKMVGVFLDGTLEWPFFFLRAAGMCIENLGVNGSVMATIVLYLDHDCHLANN
jgi:hypothetical protein